MTDSRDEFVLEHIFDRLCKEEDIQNRLTKVCHLWTNGQVESVSRVIKSVKFMLLLQFKFAIKEFSQ